LSGDLFLYGDIARAVPRRRCRHERRCFFRVQERGRTMARAVFGVAAGNRFGHGGFAGPFGRRWLPLWGCFVTGMTLIATPVRGQAPTSRPAPQPEVVAEPTPPVAAAAEPTLPPELVAAITKEQEATVKAFNAGDAAALGNLFMEQGELIDENGTLTAGRKAITALFQAFFQRFPKANLQMEVTGLRQVGDDLAVEEGVRLITVDDGQTAAQLRYVAVRDKVGDGWPIASYREFADDPLPTPAEMLQGVGWLVGDWIDESPEGRTLVSYRWSDDGNFLVGEYTLSIGGAEASKSAHRIGFDPVAGALRSWTFDSDGGFSEGEWYPVETGWLIKSSATLPDGTTGSATVELTPVDDDHFTLRSADRIVGGVEEPDFELKIARRPPQPGAGAPPPPPAEKPPAGPTK